MKKEDGVTFHAYQEVAGNVVRGTTDDRVKLLFRMLDAPVERTVRSRELAEFTARMVETAARIVRGDSQREFEVDASSAALAEGLLADLLLPEESAKATLYKE